MALVAGNIAFVGFNADGSDDFAFVAIADISLGETITFEDNEWDGSAFNSGEGRFTWTADSLVTAGTIVRFSSTSLVTKSVSTGTLSAGTLSIGNNDEVIYAYQGSVISPTFITAIANGGFNAANGLLTNTGLTAGTNAIDFSTVDDDLDIAAYNGTRSGQSSFVSYLPLINNPANWLVQDASGDQSIDGTAPDVPFSSTAFAIASIPTVNLSVDANSRLESDSTTITVTATASTAVVGNQTVTIAASGTGITAGDFNLSNTTITILDGQTTGSVTFSVVNDSVLEGNEVAALTISNPSSGIGLGATTLQNITITDNDTIQITEYAYSAINGEFIEFTNVGDTAIDLTSWSFDDSSRTAGSFSLGAFGTVAAGESVILTESTAAAFRTAWGLSNSVKVIGGLNQNLGRGDEINIYDNTNAQVDRLTYGDQTFSGTIQTLNRSGWTFRNNLDPFTINNSWFLASASDAQNSITSSGGDIGSPGTFVAIAPVTNAPTVQVNTTATTNFLDGGTLNLLNISGSGAVSGVINDPTDSAKNLGIDFTIADTDTPIGNLTVTAISNNQSVVSNANLSLTGTGASRNLKITPSAVGLANITVTVSDGTNTSNYVINYGASAASVNPTTTRFLTGTSDASSAIAIDSTYAFVADDEDQTIRLYDRTNSGLPINQFNFTSSLGLSGGSEVDIEASSRVGNTIYWLGSHSNNSGGSDRPNRERIFSTTISGTGAASTLAFGGYYQFLEDDLIAWDNNNGHGLGAGFLGLAASAANGVLPEQSSGFNIEGLTFAPDGTTAYVSFRAPQSPTSTRTDALIIAVTNFTSILNGTGGTSGSANFAAPIFLDLGGRGIRSIERNSSNQYLIVAGPAGSAMGTAPNDFRLYTWDGIPSNAPVLRAADLTGLSASGGSFESIIEVPNSLTASSQIELLVDNGDTIWYGDGTVSKDLAQTNQQKFRREVIQLGASNFFVYNIDRSAISVTEGNSGTQNLTYTINRVGTGATSTVNYALGGTATLGNDYTTSSSAIGTVTFGANETSKTITLSVVGDTNVESNETIILSLSNPQLGTLGNNNSTIIINNDDLVSGDIIGTAGNDSFLIGTQGNDTIRGLTGTDRLTGGDGNDRLFGGPGRDTLTGGTGADFYSYESFADSVLNNMDSIPDFIQTEGDRFEFTNTNITGLFNAGVLTGATINVVTASAFADKDKDKDATGSQILGQNEAVFFNWNGGTYLGVNDGVSTFSSSDDFLTRITRFQGIGSASVSSLSGTLNVSDYIVLNN